MTGLEKVTLRYISLIMKGNHNLLWVKFVGGDGDSTVGINGGYRLRQRGVQEGAHCKITIGNYVLRVATAFTPKN